MSAASHRRLRVRTSARLVAAGLAAALVVAACGEPADPDAGSDGTPPAAAEQDPVEPVAPAPDPEPEPAPDPDEVAPAVEHADDEADDEADDAAGADDGSAGDDQPDEDPQPDDDGRGRLVIHHVGDVSLDVSDVPVLARGEPAGAWDGVRDTFDDADLVLANLECAATDGGAPQDKEYVFRCSLDALPHMREAGVDVVTLANNHSGDLGMDGMLDSVANVEAAGIATVGVGENESAAYTPHVIEVAGWRVAVLGFGGVVPVADWTARGGLPGQATGYDPARMAEAVAAAREDADLVIASVHWGEEGAEEPRPEDLPKVEAMIDAGADVVFGHHAHRLQPLEVVDDVPVFWNLGNFVWPRTGDAAARTAVGEYVVEPDGTVRPCLRPFTIDHDGVPRPTGEDPRCADTTRLR